MDTTPHSYEILVVDDASGDRTGEAAHQAGARVVRRPVQGGSGASRKTGLVAAQGQIVVMLDADGTYDAADIPEMLSFFPEFDQVNGARSSEQGTLKFLRVPAKWLIRQLACYLAGVRIPDLNTGLKAFKRDVMMRYLWVIPDGFSCVTTMTLAFLCNGHPVKYIPTRYYPRIGRSKFHPIHDTQQYLQTVVRVIMYFNPLKVFMPIAFWLGVIGVVKTLVDQFFGIGRMQLSDIVILVTAVLVGVLGLMADLIVSQMRALGDWRQFIQQAQESSLDAERR